MAMEIDEGVRQVRDSRLLDDQTFNKEFLAAFGSTLQIGARHYTPAEVTNAKEAAIAIAPSAFLQAIGSQHSRLRLFAICEIDLPGTRSFSWVGFVESAQVLPNFGPGSWTDLQSQVLRDAVAGLAPHLVVALKAELELRLDGSWREPIDPSKCFTIWLRSDGPDVNWRYYPILETESHIYVAREEAKGLGVLAQRHAIDKRLIRRLERVPL